MLTADGVIKKLLAALRAQTSKKAKAELEQRRGAGFKYEAMVGTRKPPLDYRD